MKRIVWLILCILGVFSCVLFYKIKPYYTPAKQQEAMLDINTYQDDTIRIAFIGDSWAEMHKSTMCIIGEIISSSINHPVQVRTEGISGLTSKNIYYSIFRNDSVRNVIEWGPDFCFIVAGINDSDRKVGKGYYKENMRLIIQLLLEHHIKPIVLEIPSYDIGFSFKRRNRAVKLLYLISMLATWSKMDCIDDYREAYINLLNEHGWGDKVITIWSKDWNPDGYRDSRALYDEGLMHLNKKGYLVLDSCIAHKVIENCILP